MRSLGSVDHFVVMCSGYGAAADYDTKRMTRLVYKARQKAQAANAGGSVVGASLDDDTSGVRSDF